MRRWSCHTPIPGKEAFRCRSSNSLATVAFVGRLLAADRDELILCYVSPAMPYAGDEQLDPGRRVRVAQAALSNAVFDEALSRMAPEWKARAERVESSGSPGAALLAIAGERKVGLIAVGFHGAGLFERFMLGSVSRAVVQSALVPVLVVKAIQASSRRSTIRYACS